MANRKPTSRAERFKPMAPEDIPTCGGLANDCINHGQGKEVDQILKSRFPKNTERNRQEFADDNDTGNYGDPASQD